LVTSISRWRSLVAWFVTWWLEDSKWGYWWRAVKDNPDAAKASAWSCSIQDGRGGGLGFLVAVGGSFYAQFVSYIDPESVDGFSVLAADGHCLRCLAASARCGGRCWARSS